MEKSLSNKLWKEYHIIYEYAEEMKNRVDDKLIQRTMNVFIGIPCDEFRRLIGYITFQEVIKLIHEGKIEDAYKNALEFKNNFMYMWDNRELNIIKTGRLLTTGH